MDSPRRGTYYALVKLDVLRNDPVCAIATDRQLARAPAHLSAQLLIAQQANGIVSHLIDIADRAEESCLAVVDDFRQTTDPRCDDGKFTGERFQGRESKRFLLRWQQE